MFNLNICFTPERFPKKAQDLVLHGDKELEYLITYFAILLNQMEINHINIEL